MSVVPDSFYENVLRKAGLPVTPENMHACHAWQAAEGGDAHWNPWNTTMPEPGATEYNSAGVRNYDSEAVGINATVRTLTNGHYDAILAAFRLGVNGYRVCVAVDQSVWGTHGAHGAYAYRFGLLPLWFTRVLRVESPMMHGPDVVALQKAFARYHAGVKVDGVYGPATGALVRTFKDRHGLVADEIFGVAAAHVLR